MSLLLALLTSLVLAGTGAPFPTDTKLATIDGKTVVASVGVPAKGGQNGVVFVHMAGRNREDWTPIADKFYRQGMLVLTVDLRGHGANVTSESPPALTGADWSAMAEDVRAGVDELTREAVPLLLRAVAPHDAIRRGERGDLVHPLDEPGVLRRGSVEAGDRRGDRHAHLLPVTHYLCPGNVLAKVAARSGRGETQG